MSSHGPDASSSAPNANRADIAETGHGGATLPSVNSRNEPLPESIGPYRILRQLGEGGMGVVYLGENAEGERVAVKLPWLAAEQPELVKRFEREARLAARLNHPHICRVLEFGRHAGRCFLAMEWIPGESLAEFQQSGRELSASDAARLVSVIARAVHAAHEEGIVHRDLKPANIMLRPGGEPVVMDFGMARRFDGGESLLTPSGAVLGTPGYMAPEQITGAAEDIGPACDIYSLGVLLYELLTGWAPFSGSLATLLGSIVSEPPIPPHRHVPDLDPQLEAICLKALEKEPADRQSSAEDLARELEAWLERGAGDPLATERAGSLAESSSPVPSPIPARFLARLWNRLQKRNA